MTRFVTMESHPSQTLYRFGSSAILAALAARSDKDMTLQYAESQVREQAGEYNRRFWEIIFEGSRRPIRWEVFRQLDDRTTRYYPLLLKVFPDPAARPRQGEVLIEFYRKGKVDEAVRAFKKNYLEVVHQMVDNLKGLGSASASQ